MICPKCVHTTENHPMSPELTNTLNSQGMKGIVMCGVEYPYGHREHYDGVSEWECPVCGYREGRWSGRVLKDGKCEYKYGIKN